MALDADIRKSPKDHREQDSDDGERKQQLDRSQSEQWSDRKK
jgi:hypothetical protein